MLLLYEQEILWISQFGIDCSWCPLPYQSSHRACGKGKTHTVRLSRKYFDHINSTVVQLETGAESHLILSSPMMMTMMAPALIIALTVAWLRPPTQESRVHLLRHRARQDMFKKGQCTALFSPLSGNADIASRTQMASSCQ